jgi:predicted hydrocarbon binding protein
MKPRKKIIFPYYYSRDKKLFQIVAEIKDVPGSLSGILDLLKSHVNLIGVISYKTTDGQAVFSGFAESLSGSQSTLGLQKLIAALPMVVEARVTEDKDGFLVDSFHTGVQGGAGESYVMMQKEALSAMLDHMVRIFGTGGETILYEEGRKFGASRGRAFKLLLGKDSVPGMISSLVHVFAALGWGQATQKPTKEGERFRIAVADCFSCSVSGEKTACDFVRGWFVGFGAEALGRELRIEETRCRLRGDVECEFVATDA